MILQKVFYNDNFNILFVNYDNIKTHDLNLLCTLRDMISMLSQESKPEGFKI